MPSLTDFIPITRRVQGLDVRGISSRNLAQLFDRYPQLAKVVTGQGANLKASDFISVGPDVVNAIIAAGCGQLGDDEAESAVDGITVSAQMELIEEIVKLTFPDGISPFVQRLARGRDAVISAANAATKGLDTNSGSQSTVSSDTDTTNRQS